MNNDKEHLKLLSKFHYLLGMIIAMFSSFFMLHIASGMRILFVRGSKHPVRTFAGFIVLPGFMTLCGMALAMCIIIGGYKFAHYRSRTYCLVVAGLECMLIPFSTVLGIISIITLEKDSVKKLFGTSRLN